MVRQITTHASGGGQGIEKPRVMLSVWMSMLFRRAVIRIDGAANLPTQEAILLNSAELARYGRPYIPLPLSAALY